MKPKARTDKPSLEERFEKEFRKVELYTLESAKRQAKRIDTYIDIASSYKEMKGEYPTVACLHNLSDKMVDAYDKMISVVEGMNVDDFKDPDFKDPYTDLYMHAENADDWDDIIVGYVEYQAVRPFGERMARLHSMIMNEFEDLS